MIVTWMTVVKLLHVLSALALVSGMLGRDLAYASARRTTELPVTRALLHLSGRFERLLVRPGSELVFVFGLLAAWLERQPMLSVLAGARPAWAFVALVLYAVTIPLVFVLVMPATRRRRAALAGALTEGQVTIELRVALDDHSVLRTRQLELVLILIVIALMVLKPF